MFSICFNRYELKSGNAGAASDELPSKVAVKTFLSDTVSSYKTIYVKMIE